VCWSLNSLTRRTRFASILAVYVTESGVCQGYVLAPDFRHRHELVAGKNCCLDFADDVALVTELLELLVPALETMASEAASLGLEVNWQKKEFQAMGSREDELLTVTVLAQEVAVVARESLQNLDNQLWKPRISTSTKLPSCVTMSPLLTKCFLQYEIQYMSKLFNNLNQNFKNHDWLKVMK